MKKFDVWKNEERLLIEADFITEKNNGNTVVFYKSNREGELPDVLAVLTGYNVLQIKNE